jgi:hypothetical protein
MNKGQITTEYAIISAMLLALVAIMGLFLATMNDYGQRILEIIAGDYP